MASIVGASVPEHARTGLKNVAAPWPRFGYRGAANPLNVLRGARGKSLWLPRLASRSISPGPRRCHDGGHSVPLLTPGFDHRPVAPTIIATWPSQPRAR